MLQEVTLSTRGVTRQDSSGGADDATQIFIWIMVTGVCQTVSVFGTFTNTINIVCFVKQGFKDPINVSLLGLAVSDLGCLVTVIWTNISLTPAFITADLPFDVLEVLYLTAGMGHLTFTRVSSWITAIVTLERCLCVIAPLQVKNMFTSRQTSITIIAVFTILMSSVAPVYVVNRLDMKFDPLRNKTLLGIVSTGDREHVEKISFAVNNFVLPFAAFFVIIFCTAVLAVSLRRRQHWLKSSSANLGTELTNRNHRVAKMVVMMSTLFIACFIPTSVIMLAVAFERSLTFGGKYINIGIVIGGIGFFLESVNSSVNIFIYYYMSTKYRDSFLDIFCKTKLKK